MLNSAGVAPWPKSFVNLRASYRTDLQERFPDHVINTLLGPSSRIAERHYLQTTEAHWGRAIAQCTAPDLLPSVNGGNAGGNIHANPVASAATLDAKIPGNMVLDAAGFPGMSLIVPPQGLEPWTR